MQRKEEQENVLYIPPNVDLEVSEDEGYNLQGRRNIAGLKKIMASHRKRVDAMEQEDENAENYPMSAAVSKLYYDESHQYPRECVPGTGTPATDKFLEYFTTFVQLTYPSWSLGVDLSKQEAICLAVAAKESDCLRLCLNNAFNLCSTSAFKDMSSLIDIQKILSALESLNRINSAILGGELISKIVHTLRQNYC